MSVAGPLWWRWRGGDDPSGLPGVVRGFVPTNALGVLRYAPGEEPIPAPLHKPINADFARALSRVQPWVPDFLTPYQRIGVPAVLTMPGGSGHFWWSAGSGKTLGAILWALADDRRVVVVTKGAVKFQWSAEVERFAAGGVKPLVLAGEQAHPIPLDGSYWIVVNYEILPAWIKEIEEWAKGLQLAPSVVFDESHKVKSHQRWKAVAKEDGGVKFTSKNNIAAAALRLSKIAARRLATTATPVKDRPRDLWAQLDLVHPGAWGKYWDFARRYCGATQGEYGMQDNGKSNEQELAARLAYVVHRVKHSEANRALPPKRRLIVRVPESEQVRPEAVAHMIREATQRGGTSLLEARLMEAAARKRKALVERVAISVTEQGKVIVFTGRKLDAEKIRDALITRFKDVGVTVLHGDGSVSPKERDEIRKAYMDHPGPCVLVGTTDAWGECVAGDTFILGANKLIATMKAGDATIGDGALAKCHDAKCHPYSGEMVEIRAQGMLPFFATPGHPVLTLPGGITTGRDRHFVFRAGETWTDVQRVRPWDPSPQHPAQAKGDFVLIPRLVGTVRDVLLDLTRHVARSRDVAARAARGCPDQLPIDTSIAWLLGLYVAEGSSTDQRKPGGCRATWSLSARETKVGQRVIEILASHGIRAKLRVQKTWLHVTTSSAPVARLFRELCGAGAENKKIPDEILFNADQRILRAFLDGYVVGDGSVSDGGNKVQAATVSKALALQLQLALARFGRLAAITPWKAASKIDGRKLNGRPYFIVTWRWHSQRHDRYKVTDRYLAVPVKKVVRHMKWTGTVGSMTTSDETFLASNALIHNGLNLHDTDLLLVGLLPYTPGQIIQLEGRVARLGQNRPVLIEYLIAEGTVDEHVAGILIDKLPIVEKMIESDEVSGLARELGGLDDPKLRENLAAKILGRLS